MSIMESVKGFVSSTSWKIKKHSPEILLVCGIVTTVAGVVTACRATLKAQDAMEEHKKQMDVIQKCEESGKTVNSDGETVEYTPEDAEKDKLTVKIKTTIKVSKLYFLSFILIGLSIFCHSGAGNRS